MMGYLDFIKKLQEVLQGKLEGKAEVRIDIVKKVNVGELETLHILEKENTYNCISPNFYTEQLYCRYQNGCSVEKTAEEILSVYEETVKVAKERREELKILADYESCRGRIYYRLVNTERNKNLLEGKVHFEILDFSMLLQVLIRGDEEGIASVAVTESLLEVWNVTESEMYEQAVRNTQKLFPAKLMKMTDALEKLLGMECDELPPDKTDWENELLVLTNEKGINGFSSILYRNELKKLADRFRKDLYILPSSTHEALVLPAEGCHSVRELQDMVREVNATAVSAEDFMSDNVYCYSWEDKELKIIGEEMTADV